MRVVFDLATAGIIQAEKTPVVGDLRPFNGKGAVPIPEMVALEVDSTSYALPVDGGDVMSLALAQMLVQYPMYSNVVFNPLLTAADVADLDLTAVFTPAGNVTRAQVGRGAGPLPTGVAPNLVAVLPQNSRVGPVRPGILITDTIDIGPLTGGVGADEFMLWWKLYDFSTTHDITSSFGATAGMDEPALRNIVEADPEPSGFEVWISNDDGATYTQVNHLEPTDLGVFGPLLRVCFRNTSAVNRQCVSAFAILF